jgi:hypothetical protein
LADPPPALADLVTATLVEVDAFDGWRRISPVTSSCPRSRPISARVWVSWRVGGPHR